MYIIGTNVDKDYKLKLTAPTMVYGTSEFCKPDDMYTLEIDVPNTEKAKSKTFSVKLYASNSNSNPYVDQGDNYWKNLVPTWKFYDENKKIIYDLTITANQKTSTGLHGSVKFHYVDDMPSSLDEPIFIWATLNLDDFSKNGEVLKVNSSRYEPPAYSNSKVIAVTTATINQVVPTKISITRNSIDPLSTGIYWSNQKIPFIATVNSDHYQTFREEDETRNDHVDFSSDIVYNFPLMDDVTEYLKGNIGITYDVNDIIEPSSLVEKYLYYNRNEKEFISTYIPPENVLETSGPIPKDITTRPKNADPVTYSYIMENMDWPTFDYLQSRYYDIDLTKYFVKINKNDIILLKVGDVVEVLDGAFTGGTGTITSMDDSTLTAVVELYNVTPETRIRVNYSSVRKAERVLVIGGQYEGHTGTVRGRDEERITATVELDSIPPNVVIIDYKYLKTIDTKESEYPFDQFGVDGADLYVLTLDNYEKLVAEHRIFDYIPYALRIVDTLSFTHEAPLHTTWCNFSAFDESKEELEFKLLDTTNGYNYKIGGYSFGMTYCPDLSGKDRWGSIYASASFGENVARRGIKFHQIKYSILTDGDGLYLADDRNNIDDNSILKAISAYLTENSIDIQTIPDHNIVNDGSLVGTNYTLGATTIKEYGASWVTQDPLFNSWIADSNSGHVTKIDIKGEIIHDINLTSAVDQYFKDAAQLQNDIKDMETDLITPENEYLLNQTITDDMLKYWNELISNEGTSIISPNCVVLNSKNEIYVTSYDQMILVKMDGMDGKVLNAWPFPDSIIKDDFPYSETYEAVVEEAISGSGGVDERFELNSGWKIVGVDTNEYDDVAVLFQTRLSPPPNTKSKEMYDLPCSIKIATLDDSGFKNVFTLYDKTGIINNDFLIDHDSWIDTSHILFRSNDDYDYIYIAGSMNPEPINSETPEKQEKYPKKRMRERVCIWRYAINKDNGKQILETVFDQTYTTSPTTSPKYHYCIGSMFFDVDYNLWFTVNKDGYQLNKAGGDSFVYTVKNAKDINLSPAQRVNGFESGINITGISQLSTFEMLILTNTKDGGEIARYKYSSDTNSVTKRSDKTIKIEPQSQLKNFGGKLFANGDWACADYLNKYARKVDEIETDDSENNKIMLYAYENYYIRKHNEEWDVAEHAKIPVIYTQFPNDNPELFKSIGVTLGVDEHKQYSIGKKLFEGIANQVNNIHDIDECHIDSIYNIAFKEDVNIDKFILSYPEELRRMVDLMSITRKKLWGKRCDCTQNYFKTKDKTARRYCKKCRHIHRSNLGRLIDPFDDSLWDLTKYRTDHLDGVSEKKWYKLRDMIADQSKVVTTIFEVEPSIACTKKELNTALKAIVPVNNMLEVFSNELNIKVKKLDIHNCSYDVILNKIHRAVGWIHSYLMAMVNAYIVEDKFNRNNSYMRVNMSGKSYKEALEILDAIKKDEYLNDYDRELMAEEKTNSKIILQVSVEEIEEQFDQKMKEGEAEMEARVVELIKEGFPADEAKRIAVEEQTEKARGKITSAQILAIHTSFFVPDQWFNYCYWRLIPRTCSKLNTGVINWDSKYTTLPEYNYEIQEDWYFDPADEDSNGKTGTMEKILNYILHNGMLFHRNQEYIDD